jgi:hypothetical protein
MLHRLSRAFALAGAVPLILLSILSLGYEIPHFFSPCFFFGETGGLRRIPLDIHSSCGGRAGGTSETMLGTIVRLILIQGTAIFMAALALKGAYRRKPQLILLAALLMFLLSIPLSLGMSGLRTLICAACFFLSFVFSKLVARQRVQEAQ